MRKLATFALSFAAAIFAVQYVLPQTLILPFAGGCAACFAVILIALHGDRRTRCALIAAGLALGLFYHSAYTHLVCAPYAPLYDTEDECVMELCGYPMSTAYGARVEVRILNRGLHGKAVYYGKDTLLELVPGQRITGRVKFQNAAEIRGSEITTFTARGVYTLLYNRGDVTVERGNEGALRYLPLQLGRALQERISLCFPERTQPFLRAILLGDRTLLTTEDDSNLREAGLYHVTAVSGLHCAFLLSLISMIVGRPRRKLLSAIAIPVLILYALAVGASPSIVRATVMMILVLLAPLFGRESDAITSLSFALLLILLANPYAAASISLQLSFAAMAGMLTLTPRIYDAFSERCRHSLQRQMLGSLAATAGALIFTAPLTAYYFDYLPLISPLSNLLCLWAASAVFALGFVTVCLSFVYLPAAQLLAVLPHYGAEYLLLCAKHLAAVPYHAIYFENDYLKYWLLYVYAMFAACALVRRGKYRVWAAGALAVLTLALCVYLNALPMSGGSLHMIALDVGQGQSVVLSSKGKTALVDCGSSNTFLSAGDIAANYLKSIGCDKLDYLILSHYHSDHTNGLPVLFTRMKIGTLIVPDIEPEDEIRAAVLDLAASHDVPVVFLTRTQKLPLGEANITVYPPMGAGTMNEEGLTALCTAGTFDILLTGDMDATTEQVLTESCRLPDIEVLMVGHHGSRYSTGQKLLQTVTPEVGVISTGENGYGHPNAETLYRLQDHGVAVYRTDLQGHIHITLN